MAELLAIDEYQNLIVPRSDQTGVVAGCLAALAIDRICYNSETELSGLNFAENNTIKLDEAQAECLLSVLQSQKQIYCAELGHNIIRCLNLNDIGQSEGTARNYQWFKSRKPSEPSKLDWIMYKAYVECDRLMLATRSALNTSIQINPQQQLPQRGIA